MTLDRQQLRHFISQLYRGGIQITADQFRPWALHQVKNLIPFDAALFASGNLSREKFHSATIVDLPEGFVGALEKTAAINPLYKAITEHLGLPYRICDVADDDSFYNGEFYLRGFQPYGVERVLTSGHADSRTSLYTLVSVYRFDREREFSDTEREILEEISFHLIQASSHAFFLHLTRPKKRRGKHLTAVVDREGVLCEAQPGFAETLEANHRPVVNGRVPFAVHEHNFSVADDGLQASIRPLGEMFMVEIWDEGPLNQLTPREREVVQAVCRGLSDKEIASEINLAPSTVSSHLYRAYKKLGVASRRALRQLLGVSRARN